MAPMGGVDQAAESCLPWIPFSLRGFHLGSVRSRRSVLLDPFGNQRARFGTTYVHVADVHVADVRTLVFPLFNQPGNSSEHCYY